MPPFLASEPPQSVALFDIAAALLGISALFGFINYRFMRLSPTIGLTIMSLAASLLIILLELVHPGFRLAEILSDTLHRIDFYETLMMGMLGLMLFAGALHVDFAAMKGGRWAILLLATVGVVISTFVVGGLLWLVTIIVGLDFPLRWALVFGALISPTDPVAVLAVMKSARIPGPLRAIIAGESLFNDGIGVVVFTILLAFATGDNAGHSVATLFFVEALGGALLGLIAGYVAFLAMRQVDEHNLEVLISLGTVTATYSVALHIGVSGLIAVVIAGLFVGTHGVKHAMSDKTRLHLLEFWSLIDHILNSVLFLLIGLEVVMLRFRAGYLEIALLAIPVVLAARFTGVWAPLALMRWGPPIPRGAIPVLVWGGLRGGIPIALAFYLPEGPQKAPILTMTYAVVVFSIIVQGLTISRVARHATKALSPE